MTKSEKLPAIQFYPGDWRKDSGVQALNFHDRGVWFELLLFMHESEERGYLLLNGMPMPDNAIANLLGLDIQILTTTLTTLLTYGVASRREDGAIYSRRMVRDEKIRQTRIKCGSMGGNPNLVNQKSTTQVNQKPTPSSSSSSSSSIKYPPTPLKWGDIGKQAALDWILHRKEKKKPVTPQQLEKVFRKYENNEQGFASDVNFSIESGYQGLFSPPHQNNPGGFNGQPPERLSQAAINRRRTQEAARNILIKEAKKHEQEKNRESDTIRADCDPPEIPKLISTE